MKQIFAGIIVLLISMSAIAQTGQISGLISDKNSSESVPFATIALYQKNFNVPLQGTVSDGNGKFLMKGIDYGKYQLVISFIGYVSDTIS